MAVYGSSWESLQDIKAIYDADNIFRYPQTVTLPS